MTSRRTFVGRIIGLLGLTSFAFGQKAIMEKGKAVVCEGDPVKCPLGHDSCKAIDAPIAVGNDSYQNPDVGQLRDYHVLRCDVCKVLFTRE